MRQMRLHLAGLSLLANALTPTIAAGAEVAPAAVAVQAQPAGPVIADGSQINVETLGLKMSPPKGWEVFTNTGSLSLMMQEPKVEVPAKLKDYSKPTFQRNITVAAIHHPSAIDERRALELEEDLKRTFSKDTMVTDFQVLEHKFFNYKGTNDGLVVYTQLNLREFKMMQMHVLVSGDSKQFLLTYTDLAEEFAKQNATYNAAWNAMVSVEVSGLAPKRFEKAIRYGSIGGGVFILFAVMFFMFRRSTMRDFLKEADALEADESGSNWNSDDTAMATTVAGNWKLNKERDDDSIDFSEPAIHHSAISHIASSYR